METLDKVSDSAHEAYDKITRASSHAVDVIGEKGEQLKKSEQRLMKNCRGYISENPIASVSIAVAASFLLSCLLCRR
ncbi:MAG: DUF883 C-terminal domain-containing protein [Methylobacter sp.]|nr:DUF883 C-terminal domain-containing protein [Methylobacter sp.]